MSEVLREIFAKAAFAAETLGPPRPSVNVSAFDFVQMILGIFTKLAIPVFTILIVFFGFQLISAMGNEQDLTDAKQKLLWTIAIAAVFLGLRVLNSLAWSTGNSIGIVAMLILLIVFLLYKSRK